MMLICTENNKIYIISLPSAYVSDIPTDLKEVKMQRVEWSVDGSMFLIGDKVKQ